MSNAKYQQVTQDVEDVKVIMHKNIGHMLANKDNLEDLKDKTSNMKETTKLFKKNATSLKRAQCCKNCNLTCLIVVAVLIVLALLAIIVIVLLKVLGFI